MARDAIGIIGMDREDEGEAPPAPSSLSSIKKPRQEVSSRLLRLILQPFGTKTAAGGKESKTIPSG